MIGIEYSEAMANMARKIIAKNGFSDRVQIIHGQMESAVVSLAEKSVDVIVSEWMGYGLYFENMLPSVMYARDKYMHPQGVVLPNCADLFVQGITVDGERPADDRVSWWGNVEGFDFSDLAGLVTTDAQVQLVDQRDVLSDRYRFHSLDIAEASSEDLDFERPFEMVRSTCSINYDSIISMEIFDGGDKLCRLLQRPVS